MGITANVDWRADLGGGVRVALIQAGVFKSDAGTVFGPVPRTMWERLVVDEIDPESMTVDGERQTWDDHHVHGVRFDRDGGGHRPLGRSHQHRHRYGSVALLRCCAVDRYREGDQRCGC